MNDLTSSSSGLSKKKLGLANAIIKYVLSGFRFYAGSKELQTGVMPNLSMPKSSGGQADTYLDEQNTSSGVSEDPANVYKLTKNGDGVKRLCIRSPFGAYGGKDKEIGSDGYCAIPASMLGNATPDKVVANSTFSSENGTAIGVNGTLPDRSKPKSAGGQSDTELDGNRKNVAVSVDPDHAYFIATNTDGVKRLCVRPPRGAYGIDGYDGYCAIPASLLGNATPDKVLSGYGFSSENENALGVPGTMPYNRQGTYARSCALFNDEVYYRIPKGYYPDGWNGQDLCEVKIARKSVTDLFGGDKGIANVYAKGNNVALPAGVYNKVNITTPGGNQGAFNKTISPGETVSIKEGYHNGEGKITAKSVGSMLKTYTVTMGGGGDAVRPWTFTLGSWGTLVGVANISYPAGGYGGEIIYLSISGNTISIMCTGNGYQNRQITLLYY